MLAVRRSLRNSDKLIRPSLSMSASSSNGSMDPFKPVCCTSEENHGENATSYGFYAEVVGILLGLFR